MTPQHFSSRRLSGARLAALALLGVLAGGLAAEAQAPPPPIKKVKTPTPTPKPQKGGGGGGQTAAPAAARATLLLDSDLNCTVTIDGETSHKIIANKPTKIEVAAGEHLLKAVSEDGRRQLEQVVKGQGGGNTVVPIKLMTVGVSTKPEDFDRQAAKVFVAITDLPIMGAYIDGMWKKSFFFHDRGITTAFHTAGQVMTREIEEFKKFPPSDANRQKVFDELVRLSTDGQKYVELITQAITAAQSANSTMGEPTNQFAQAQAILATLKVPADCQQILRDAPAFKEAVPPDARPRIGLPRDTRDISLGANYAHSYPQMFTVVDKGGAADNMGFKPGDRVISVDGRPVASIWDFKLALRQAGGRASVVFEREGKQEKKDVKGPTS
jgi:hypothetical protein